jgi:hypothetical protein
MPTSDITADNLVRAAAMRCAWSKTMERELFFFGLAFLACQIEPRVGRSNHSAWPTFSIRSMMRTAKSVPPSDFPRRRVFAGAQPWD